MYYPTHTRDHIADIVAYEDSVLNGDRPANRYEILAVKRGRDDLAQAEDQDFQYYFDTDSALRFIKFAETFSHVRGKWAAKRGSDSLITLEGWQKWIFAQVFGWKRKDNGLRRYTSAEIYVPRKNAKSTKSAIVGLWFLGSDGEYSPEVFCGATCEKQADEVFRTAMEMARKQPAYLSKFGVGLHAKKIEKTDDKGRFERLIGKPGDGGSPSLYIGDEYHEHPDNEQRETMTTGMMSRAQPLEWIISTAGSDWFGPCGTSWQECIDLLEDPARDPDKFCVIYTVDKDDDWTTEEALIKANPNYGVSVIPDNVKRQQRKAIAQVNLQNPFKTKHLNLWVGARESWLNMESWQAASDAPPIEEFEGAECVKGIDLSEWNDLSSDGFCFENVIDGKTHYYLYSRSFTTEEQARDIAFYQEWVDKGFLLACDGSAIDYDEVERHFSEDVDKFHIERLMFDPKGAFQMAQRINADHGVETAKCPTTFEMFSEAMLTFEILLAQGRIHHDGNPVLNWCMGNVIAKTTMDGKHRRPVKEHKRNKIDAAIAVLMAFIGCYTEEEQRNESILEYLD